MVPRVKDNNPLARKRPFLWISQKSRLVRAARETSKFHLPNGRPRYMDGILPIRRKTQNNQSINQSINLFVITKTCIFDRDIHDYALVMHCNIHTHDFLKHNIQQQIDWIKKQQTNRYNTSHFQDFFVVHMLFSVLLGNIFLYMETSPLPMKCCKLRLTLGACGHRALRILKRVSVTVPRSEITLKIKVPCLIWCGTLMDLH